MRSKVKPIVMNFLKCVGYLALIGILAHFVGEAMPRRWFDAAQFPWRSAQWEREGKIYNKLHIRAWKDKLPDMSRFMPDMLPKQVSERATSYEIDCQVRETCVAELIHVLLAVFGYLCVFLWNGMGGWILATVFALGNVPFILIQRHNRPRLWRLQHWLAVRETGEAAEEQGQQPIEDRT